MANLGLRTALLLAHEDSKLRLVDLATGRPVAQPVLVDDTHITALVVLRIDGRTVALGGCADGSLYAWDLRPLKIHHPTRRFLRRLPKLKEIIRIRGEGSISALAVRGKQDLVVARGSQVELRSLSHTYTSAIELNAPVTSIATPDFSTLVIGTDQGTVVIDLPCDT